MRREAVTWLLAFAVATVGLVTIMWLFRLAPLPWKLVVWYVVLAALAVANWVMTGYTIAEVIAWTIPVIAVGTMAVLGPSVLSAVVSPLLATAPMLGAFVPVLGRAIELYVGPAGDWILRHSVRGEDGRTWRSLLHAISGDARMRADERRIENAALVIETQRRHAGLILAVPAPDPRWSQAIRVAATPRIVYRQMLEGTTRLDYDRAAAVTANADAELRAFIASRSAAYGFLSRRFAESRGEPTRRPRSM